MIHAHEAIDRLRKGNRRYRLGSRRLEALTGPARRAELVDSQNPFAAILGCSDSRVPPEIIFDQGLGDLFVVRVAGNVAGASQIGSIELAVEQFGVRLVVVLGHSRCGAILTALDALSGEKQGSSPHLTALLDRVRPSVEPLMATLANDRGRLVEEAVRANVRASVRELRHGSDFLGRSIERDGLVVLGAEYSLTTGAVVFFEDLPRGIPETNP